MRTNLRNPLHPGLSTKHVRKIAVPSRLYVATSPKCPLAGWRIAVKDNFQIKEIPTSICNRAYYELNDTPQDTAACIKILIEAGAVIAGTTKLASFAATEEPVECIDWPAPWNPRADGYQSPAGSSSGSGAAIASYDWLDITIGSDSKSSERHNTPRITCEWTYHWLGYIASGSGRRPGHWNGCFAMRPTHSLLPRKGFIPSFEQVNCFHFGHRC